jgi:hypothetical protein
LDFLLVVGFEVASAIVLAFLLGDIVLKEKICMERISNHEKGNTAAKNSHGYEKECKGSLHPAVSYKQGRGTSNKQSTV